MQRERRKVADLVALSIIFIVNNIDNKDYVPYGVENRMGSTVCRWAEKLPVP